MLTRRSGVKPNSVQLQFIAVFFAVFLLMLILLNSYPLFVSRDLVFSSKESSLQAQASVMSSSLGALEALNEEDVARVMELLDVMPLNRILITNASGKVLYDTSSTDPRVGSFALLSEINLALTGKNVFYSKLSDNAFMSRAAAPVMNKGVVLGAVYLYEYDEQQGELIAGIQSNLRNISLAIGVAAAILISILTRTLTRRITKLVEAVRTVSEGEYDYRMEIHGSDELAELGEEFNNLTSRLQSTEDLRRRFVSDASHELKTPLASIRLLSDSIAQSEDMNLDTMREFVTDIGNEAERLQRTTEKLLSLTRLDSEIQTVRVPVNITSVAESALHMLAPLARTIDVTLEFKSEDGCVIIANEDDIYQIIFNLIENGIKYNVPGGTVSLSLSADDECVTMLVEDTGIGVPEEDLPHIFSRFYRVDKARARDAGGSGLGLSIVRDAVVLHGGSVTARRRSEVGTRFIVTFPLYPETEVPE